MQNSLSPAFVKINYTSQYAPHVMTVPSVPLIAAAGEDAPPYFDLRGAEIDVSVVTGVTDFVNIIKPMFPPGTTFTDYTVFSQPGVGDIPVPVWSAALGIAGTAGSAADKKAIQNTFTFRATDFSLFKLVLLDVPNDLGFDRRATLAGSAPHVAMSNYVTAQATWIASRGGGRPKTFLQYSSTLNEKLRRSYKMT